VVRVSLASLLSQRAAAAVFVLGVLTLSGCSSMSTRKGFYEPITAELRRDSFDLAAQKLNEAAAKGRFGNKDRLLFYLDGGLAEHYAHRFDSSNIRLSEAESAADELFTRGISRAALSLVLNDNALEYAGEDYEILYANLIKALNYAALDDYEGSLVEIKRATERLNLLEQKYRDAAQALQNGDSSDTARVKVEYAAKAVRFNNSAFARYLGMHLYATAGQYDDARVDQNMFQSAFAEQPLIYPFPAPNVKLANDSEAVLSVVGLAGLSPVKEAMDLRIRTDKQLNLVQVLYTDPQGRESQYGQLPIPVSEDYYFKFSIPQLVARPTAITRVRVLADGKPAGELQLLEDVGAVATETFEAKKSLIYLRSLARAVFKGLATHKMKKKADTGGAEGWLKKLVIDVGADIIENADLRCSRLLPGKIYAGDFKIESGTYDLTIEFIGGDGTVVSSRRIDKYRVTARGFNLVEAVSLK